MIQGAIAVAEAHNNRRTDRRARALGVALLGGLGLLLVAGPAAAQPFPPAGYPPVSYDDDGRPAICVPRYDSTGTLIGWKYACGADTPATRAAAQCATGGDRLFRVGTLGQSTCGESQYWFTRADHPLRLDPVRDLGFPPNHAPIDSMCTGTLRPGTPFVARPYAMGGGRYDFQRAEIICPSGGVQLETFHTGVVPHEDDALDYCGPGRRFARHAPRCPVPPAAPTTTPPAGGGGCRARFDACAMRFGPGLNRAATCGPDMINNGLVMGEGGWRLGTGLTSLVSDDPNVVYTGGGAGAAWFGTIGAETAFYSQTGQLLLPARFSPSLHTARGLQMCGNGARAAATNPLTIVVAGGVYLNYEANNYRLAVNDLVAMDDLSGISEDEFEAMIPYNLVSGAYWQNVGAFYGLCDPLPPPRTTFRRRPPAARCGGNVAAPNVDPPYQDGGDDLGGCTTGRGGTSAGASALLMCALGALLRRRRRVVSEDMPASSPPSDTAS